MSRRVKIHDAIPDDVGAGLHWCELYVPGSGVAFLAGVRQTIREVIANPFAFGRCVGETKAAPIDGTKFVLYYRVLPDRITMLCIQHESASYLRFLRRRA